MKNGYRFFYKVYWKFHHNRRSIQVWDLLMCIKKSHLPLRVSLIISQALVLKADGLGRGRRRTVRNAEWGAKLQADARKMRYKIFIGSIFSLDVSNVWCLGSSRGTKTANPIWDRFPRFSTRIWPVFSKQWKVDKKFAVNRRSISEGLIYCSYGETPVMRPTKTLMGRLSGTINVKICNKKNT